MFIGDQFSKCFQILVSEQVVRLELVTLDLFDRKTVCIVTIITVFSFLTCAIVRFTSSSESITGNISSRESLQFFKSRATCSLCLNANSASPLL